MEVVYPVEVRLLKITSLGEELIEWAGRLCYNTQDKMGQNPEWIKRRIAAGHDSVIEHASASFYIKASRVFTHELVRHRIASYSQRSQRYVSEKKPEYIMPPEIKSDLSVQVFTKAMEHCWGAYSFLLEQGFRPEIARYVLPNACRTEIVVTANFREWRHFIKLRTSQRALPEMRAVAGKIRDILKEEAPKVFSDL